MNPKSHEYFKKWEDIELNVNLEFYGTHLLSAISDTYKGMAMNMPPAAIPIINLDAIIIDAVSENAMRI